MIRVVNFTPEESRIFRESEAQLASHVCQCGACIAARGAQKAIYKAEAERSIRNMDEVMTRTFPEGNSR